jgi:hypothetical protein
MSFLVAEGDQLLAEQAARDQREQLETDAITQVATTLPALLRMMESMITRLDRLEAALNAPRIRYPIRDEAGAITSVVDEIVRN